MRIHKLAAGVVAVSIILPNSIPNPVFATETSTVQQLVQQKLTLEMAMENAIANSMQVRQIQTAKDNALKAHSASETRGMQASGMLHEYNVYKNLTEYGAGSTLQLATLEMYQAMFGPQPALSFEQIYDQFIVPSEVVPYQMYVQHQSLKIDEPNVISSVAYQTKQMYYGILSYQHTVSLMQESLKITEQKITEMQLKYKLGQVSKASLDLEQLGYTKSLLELEKQKKELKALEMQFNGLLNKPMNNSVLLADPGLVQNKNVVDYTELVNKALLNRGDLKKKQFEIDSLAHEVKVMTQYLRDSKLDRRVDADQRLLSAKLSKEELENSIKAEILQAYSAYKQAAEQLDVSTKKLELSEKQLIKMKQLYKVGYAKKLDVYGVELQLQNSKLAHETAVYEYNKQLDGLSRITQHGLN